MQETLDRASQGRTTIVVSHRMSAIKNADRIVFIHKGQVIEDGTHNELIALKGHYYEMVKSTHHELEDDDESQSDDEDNQTLAKKHSILDRHFNLSLETTEEDSDRVNESVAFWMSFKRILKLVQPDWIILTIAVCSSIVLGFTLPLFSVVFAEVYAVSQMKLRNILLDW